MEELRAQIRKKRPVVHCITNIVTVNDCANVLLAVGASPVMAHDPREVAEVTEHASALVCNMGAMESYDAMLCAGNRAFRLGHSLPLGLEEVLLLALHPWGSEVAPSVLNLQGMLESVCVHA